MHFAIDRDEFTRKVFLVCVTEGIFPLTNSKVKSYTQATVLPLFLNLVARPECRAHWMTAAQPRQTKKTSGHAAAIQCALQSGRDSKPQGGIRQRENAFGSRHLESSNAN
jgi:hypothetical protein